jgi:acyl carrier protein
MDAERELRRAFAVGLNLSEEDVRDELTYAVSPGWDSLAHMTLVASLEEAFGIVFEPDDVIEMSSYSRVRALLAKRGVAF